jgi:hypothetical protein
MSCSSLLNLVSRVAARLRTGFWRAVAWRAIIRAADTHVIDEIAPIRPLSHTRRFELGNVLTRGNYLVMTHPGGLSSERATALATHRKGGKCIVDATGAFKGTG